MRPAASMRRPEASENTQARNERHDPPTAPRNDQDKPRKIRRLGDPKPPASEKSPEQTPDSARKSFRGFGRGDLSQHFKDRSR